MHITVSNLVLSISDKLPVNKLSNWHIDGKLQNTTAAVLLLGILIILVEYKPSFKPIKCSIKVYLKLIIIANVQNLNYIQIHIPNAINL